MLAAKTLIEKRRFIAVAFLQQNIVKVVCVRLPGENPNECNTTTSQFGVQPPAS